MIVVTNTGGRPDALALCARWMARQTIGGPVSWIVAHDVDLTDAEREALDAMPAHWRVETIRADWTWRPGRITQAALLRLALRRARDVMAHGEPVAIVEDDDYYPARYLADIAEMAARCDPRYAVVGYSLATYYNVRHRMYRHMRNVSHASLCESAVVGEAVDMLMDICATRERSSDRKAFIDIEMWARARASKPHAEPMAMLCEGAPGRDRPIGMKGLPGRGGIGSGHAPGRNWGRDPSLAWLRAAIGVDAEHYARFACT